MAKAGGTCPGTGPYGDELVRFETDGNGDLGDAEDKDYYVQQDALYNVVAVVDKSGGSDDGHMVERCEYDPYGATQGEPRGHRERGSKRWATLAAGR